MTPPPWLGAAWEFLPVGVGAVDLGEAERLAEALVEVLLADAPPGAPAGAGLAVLGTTDFSHEGRVDEAGATIPPDQSGTCCHAVAIRYTYLSKGYK
jgi:hypothetical protein